MTTLNSFQKTLVILSLISSFLLSGTVVHAKPAEILGIDFKQLAEDRFDIIINSDGDLRYTAKFIRDPFRIELLFSDTKFKMRQAIPTEENPYVHQVVATMLTSPDTDKTAQITIDLKSEFQYAVEGVPEGIVIHLSDAARTSELAKVSPISEPIEEEIDPPAEKSEDIWAEVNKANNTENPDSTVAAVPENAPMETSQNSEPTQNTVDAVLENKPAETPQTVAPDTTRNTVTAVPENKPAQTPQTAAPDTTRNTVTAVPENKPAQTPQTAAPDTTRNSVTAVPENKPVQTTQNIAPSPSQNTAPPVSSSSAPPVPIENIPADPGNDLVIGPEDLLDISVFQLPEFSLSARVLGDGTITMPLVGALKLSGLTRQQAEIAISRALTAKQVNRPSVSVTIREFKSRQVSVLGSVKTAGIYYLTSNRTLLQLLSEAGGLTTDAGSTCFIFRGTSKVMVDLHDLMQNGNQQLNIDIKPGDVVNIPSLTRTFVYVLGAVKSPGAVEFIPSVGLTLAAAIARAGGPTRLANLSNIQIKRKDQSGVERVIKANLKDIINNKVPDITLLSDDLVNVPESFF